MMGSGKVWEAHGVRVRVVLPVILRIQNVALPVPRQLRPLVVRNRLPAVEKNRLHVVQRLAGNVPRTISFTIGHRVANASVQPAVRKNPVVSGRETTETLGIGIGNPQLHGLSGLRAKNAQVAMTGLAEIEKNVPDERPNRPVELRVAAMKIDLIAEKNRPAPSRSRRKCPLGSTPSRC